MILKIARRRPNLTKFYPRKSFDMYTILPITCKYRGLTTTYQILNDFKGLFCDFLLIIITTRGILKLTMINPLNLKLEGSYYKLALTRTLNYNIFDFERILSNFLENQRTWSASHFWSWTWLDWRPLLESDFKICSASPNLANFKLPQKLWRHN